MSRKTFMAIGVTAIVGGLLLLKPRTVVPPEEPLPPPVIPPEEEPPQLPVGLYGVSGTVTLVDMHSQYNNMPVPGATIIIGGNTQVTGVDGKFSFPNKFKSDTQQAVSIGKSGYKTTNTYVWIPRYDSNYNFGIEPVNPTPAPPLLTYDEYMEVGELVNHMWDADWIQEHYPGTTWAFDDEHGFEWTGFAGNLASGRSLAVAYNLFLRINAILQTVPGATQQEKFNNYFGIAG